MSKRKKYKIPGVSFSWKRATGITKVKRKIAKATGIPTTKSGRQRKIGKIMTGGGCLIYLLGGLGTVLFIVSAVICL